MLKFRNLHLWNARKKKEFSFHYYLSPRSGEKAIVKKRLARLKNGRPNVPQLFRYLTFIT